MTREEALRDAERRSGTAGRILVVYRPDHPTGPAHYAIRDSEKVRWADGETLIATFQDGKRL